MATNFAQRIGAAFQDRKTQVGAVAALSLIALGGVGVIGVMAAGQPEPPSPEMAQRARLAIVMQPVREDAAMVPHGQLATVDPSQEGATRTTSYPQSSDPELQAMLKQQAREDAASRAEQRAFEAKLNAELAGPSSDDDTPREPPAQHSSTSNSEDPI